LASVNNTSVVTSLVTSSVLSVPSSAMPTSASHQPTSEHGPVAPVAISSTTTMTTRSFSRLPAPKMTVHRPTGDKRQPLVNGLMSSDTVSAASDGKTSKLFQTRFR
jgi:hypothetical protein